MPQTPFPPGEPHRSRAGETGRVEPIIVAQVVAEQQVAAARVASLALRSSPARSAPSWREVSWVGFAGDAALPSHVVAPRSSAVSTLRMAAEAPVVGNVATDAAESADNRWSSPDDASIGPPGPPAVAGSLSGGDAVVGVALQLSGLGRLLRIAVVATSVGAVAVFAYQGGERQAKFVTALTFGTAADHPDAAVLASDRAAPAIVPATAATAAPAALSTALSRPPAIPIPAATSATHPPPRPRAIRRPRRQASSTSAPFPTGSGRKPAIRPRN